MDFGWMPYFNSFWWMFPLCLLFMLFMMLACGRMLFRGGHRNWRTGSGETPREILDRRYASGEIGKDQYDAMRRHLHPT